MKVGILSLYCGYPMPMLIGLNVRGVFEQAGSCGRFRTNNDDRKRLTTAKD